MCHFGSRTVPPVPEEKKRLTTKGVVGVENGQGGVRNYYGSLGQVGGKGPRVVGNENDKGDGSYGKSGRRDQ